MNTPGQQRQLRAIYLVLVLGTFLLYFQMLGHGFISLDDGQYVRFNTHVKQGLTARGIVWAFASGNYAANWHPLTWISHMIDCELFGLAHPGGHHLVNLLFHIASTLLLFEVFRRMTGMMWRSAMVAALFAWHPLHVESVAWISERKDVLSAFFWMLTMLSYTAYVEQVKTGGAKVRSKYLLTLLWFALGLMSKPMVVTLPFVLLLMDYWPLGRIQLTGLKTAWPTLKKLALEKVPFLALTFISSVVTFLVQKHGGAVSEFTVVPLNVRVCNALISYVRYLGKIFWPVNLSVLYPLQVFPVLMAIAAAIFLLVISALALIFARRNRWFFVGWFWFLGTLVPVIGLIQVGKQGLADRYSYLPSIGVFMIVVWAAAEVLERLPRFRPAGIAIGTAALCGCIAVTTVQLSYWKNTVTLFNHALAVGPVNAMALGNLGLGLEEQGKPLEAMAKYQQALQLEPNSAPILGSVGYNLASRGKYHEAVEYDRRSLAIEDSADARYNLGNALTALGQFAEAQSQYELALRKEPDAPDCENNLGAVLMRQGKTDDAIAHFEKALRLQPDFPEAQDQLAAVLEKKGQLELARAHYSEAIRLKPDFAHAQLRLGLVMAELGDVAPAIPHFQEAIKLESTNSEAYFDLGAAYAALGVWQPAVQAFEEAARLKPNAETRKRLAEARAKAGGNQIPKDPNTQVPKEIPSPKTH